MDYRINIIPNETGRPIGQLATAEIHFLTGLLAGLKLIGFGIWERRGGIGYAVTFPARQYSVNGERRSFALLRPIVDQLAQENLREVLIQAYREHVELAAADPTADQGGF